MCACACLRVCVCVCVACLGSREPMERHENVLEKKKSFQEPQTLLKAPSVLNLGYKFLSSIFCI